MASVDCTILDNWLEVFNLEYNKHAYINSIDGKKIWVLAIQNCDTRSTWIKSFLILTSAKTKYKKLNPICKRFWRKQMYNTIAQQRNTDSKPWFILKKLQMTNWNNYGSKQC